MVWPHDRISEIKYIYICPEHVVAMATRSPREAVGDERTGSDWQAWETVLPGGEGQLGLNGEG